MAWAHPKFGPLFAQCSYDGQVVIWKQGNLNEWTQAHVCNDHKSSINSIPWAPHVLRLCLALVFILDQGILTIFLRKYLWAWTFCQVWPFMIKRLDVLQKAQLTLLLKKFEWAFGQKSSPCIFFSGIQSFPCYTLKGEDDFSIACNTSRFNCN